MSSKMTCAEFKEWKVLLFRRGEDGKYCLNDEDAKPLRKRLEAHLKECGECNMREMLLSVERTDFGAP